MNRLHTALRRGQAHKQKRREAHTYALLGCTFIQARNEIRAFWRNLRWAE